MAFVRYFIKPFPIKAKMDPEQVEAVINAVEKRKSIYDKTSPEYSNRIYLNNEWKKIAVEVGCRGKGNVFFDRIEFCHCNCKSLHSIITVIIIIISVMISVSINGSSR